MLIKKYKPNSNLLSVVHVIKFTSSLQVLNVLLVHTYTWSFILMGNLLSLVPFKSVRLEHIQERTWNYFFNRHSRNSFNAT